MEPEVTLNDSTHVQPEREPSTKIITDIAAVVDQFERWPKVAQKFCLDMLKAKHAKVGQ